MSIDYLYNVVKHHPIAAMMAHFADLYLKGVTYHALPERIRKLPHVKPVEREMVSGYTTLVLYTWEIEKNELEILKTDTARISSKPFWSCGHRMRMILKKDNTGIYGFRTTINLIASCLPKESEFEVSWSYKCENFDSSDISGIHLFSKKKKEMTQQVVLLNITQSFSIHICMSPRN